MDPSDIKRFAELGLVASIQPSRYYMDSDYYQETVPMLAKKRANERYLLGDFKKAGVNIAFGSDWPWGTVSRLNGPVQGHWNRGDPKQDEERLIDEYELMEEVTTL